MIDPRAIIDPDARIGSDVEVGPWTLIGPGVELGDGCRIASHVVIKGPTRFGRRNRVYPFAVIGEDTSDQSYRGEPTELLIGDDNTFRESVSVHRGTVKDRGRTVIGNHCLFMPHVHVAHDCVIGNHVILANYAAVSGHVTVGDYANFGGYAGVAQYRSVGAHTHIVASSLVIKDVPDFVMAGGNPARAIGLNLEGMRRRGLTPARIASLRQAYDIIYRQRRIISEALEALAPLATESPEVAGLAASVAASRWGIVRPRATGDARDV
ncbi:MAG: acyl-ACP--UDP-N-acetylglucosamine O-acyltransferase [Pseudomonadales bacterium]|jgi:UDP-N-acetylglucosamine acyltransferase